MKPAIILVLASLCSCGQEHGHGSQEIREWPLTAEGLGAEFVVSSDLDDHGDEPPPDQEKATTRRREAILAELESLGGDGIWGTYYEGDGLGMNATLSVAPKSGAVYTWYGCMGFYDGNQGDVVHVDDRTIYLDLAVDPLHNRRWYPADLPVPFMSSEWCVVDWGTRRYMIPSSQMIPFCNAVNDGGLPRFPARSLTGERVNSRMDAVSGREPPEGLPDVPSRYREFLLEQQITAEATWIGEPKQVGTYTLGQPQYQVLVDIDAGRADGLLPGMTMRIEGRSRPVAEVVSVEDETARVRVIGSDRLKFPAKGYSLTTGPKP